MGTAAQAAAPIAGATKTAKRAFIPVPVNLAREYVVGADIATPKAGRPVVFISMRSRLR